MISVILVVRLFSSVPVALGALSLLALAIFIGRPRVLKPTTTESARSQER